MEYTMLERLIMILTKISYEKVSIPMIAGAITELVIPIAGILLIVYLIKQLKKK